MEPIEVLQAREAEVAREWSWLVEAINEVAAAAENGDQTLALRVLHDQAMAVGQRRNELWQKLAQFERPAAATGASLW